MRAKTPRSRVFVLRDIGNGSEAFLQIGFRGDIIGHLAVVKSAVSRHIEIPRTRKAEQNDLFLARLFAFERLVDSSFDGVR